MNNIYAITDLNGYALQVREAAARLFTKNKQDNLDEYITLGQIINVVNEECLGYDDKDNPILDEDTNEKIFNIITVWIHNCGLAKLAAKDLIECAWDDNENEIIFWSSKTEKKETKNVQRKNARRKNKKTKRPDC